MLRLHTLRVRLEHEFVCVYVGVLDSLFSFSLSSLLVFPVWRNSFPVVTLHGATMPRRLLLHGCEVAAARLPCRVAAALFLRKREEKKGGRCRVPFCVRSLMVWRPVPLLCASGKRIERDMRQARRPGATASPRGGGEGHSSSLTEARGGSVGCGDDADDNGVWGNRIRGCAHWCVRSEDRVEGDECADVRLREGGTRRVAARTERKRGGSQRRRSSQQTK